MAINVTPFVGTDNFNMETFNNMISQINNGVNSEISEVLAQLGTKAKIQTGSYIGTGTYGSDNPCSLAFESVPKFVYIKSFGSSCAGFFLPYTLTDSFTNFAYQGFTENAGLQASNLHAKFKNLTLSWYSAGAYTDAKYQLNSSGITYNYIAII